jgi:transposase
MRCRAYRLSIKLTFLKEAVGTQTIERGKRKWEKEGCEGTAPGKRGTSSKKDKI